MKKVKWRLLTGIIFVLDLGLNPLHRLRWKLHMKRMDYVEPNFDWVNQLFEERDDV